MEKNNNIQRYPRAMRVMHWLVGLIIISMLASGIIMAKFMHNDFRWTVYALHKSFGVMVFVLVMLRIYFRISYQKRGNIPPLPANLPRYTDYVAKITYFMMYLAMVILPVSGYCASNSFGHKVLFFGIALPDIVSKNEFSGAIFSWMHMTLPYILIGLISVHISAVIKHKYIDKQDILPRML